MRGRACKRALIHTCMYIQRINKMVVYVQADKEKMEAEQRAAAELARRQAAEAADALRAKEAAIKAREDELRKVFFSSNCVLILIFSWQL